MSTASAIYCNAAHVSSGLNSVNDFATSAILIGDERLDTRISVLRRARHIGESTGHLSIHDIGLGTAFGGGTDLPNAQRSAPVN
jgi:hypothetical protein